MHPKLSHPFARLRVHPARVIVGAIAVRARSRVSESAVHAFGRRDRDALRPSYCTPNHPISSNRASCAPGAETRRFDPSNLPRAEACASCSFSAAYFRGPFSRRRFRFFESAYTGGLGARRCGTRPGDRAFHDARTAGRIDRARVGIVRPCTRPMRLRPGCLCRLLRAAPRSLFGSGRATKAAEVDSMRALVKAIRTSSTRDTFHRQDLTHRAHATYRVRGPCCCFESFPRGKLLAENLLSKTGALT
jgi:hypothetical protein